VAILSSVYPSACTYSCRMHTLGYACAHIVSTRAHARTRARTCTITNTHTHTHTHTHTQTQTQTHTYTHAHTNTHTQDRILRRLWADVSLYISSCDLATTLQEATEGEGVSESEQTEITTSTSTTTSSTQHIDTASSNGPESLLEVALGCWPHELLIEACAQVSHVPWCLENLDIGVVRF